MPDLTLVEQPAAAVNGARLHAVATATIGKVGRRLAAAGRLDDDLDQATRRSSYMRQLFYVVVLLVALGGQVSGAVEALGIPLLWAVPSVGALELGGIVVLANADVRRRLGEKAYTSRLLSAAIAAGAVAFNWIAHSNKLHGGFFAGMSALGYLVWLMHTENQRRDRLRANEDLPPAAPAYEIFSHWLRHPLITARAKSLAKADIELGLYGSLAAARSEIARERRLRSIARVLRKDMTKTVGRDEAKVVVAVFDLDEVAARVADDADYDGLASRVQSRLNPARLVTADASGRGSRARPGRTPKAISGRVSQVRPDAPSSASSDASGDASETHPKRTTRRGPRRTPKVRSDADLTAQLETLPRDPDGTVPVRRATNALKVGAPKAKELLRATGLIPPGVT